jgi:hypothetical protein
MGLCLAFLQGRCEKNATDNFRKECAKLNAFTCEFLEYLLVTIPLENVKITWDFFLKVMSNSL